MDLPIKKSTGDPPHLRIYSRCIEGAKGLDCYYYYAAFNAPRVGHRDDESQARGTVAGSDVISSSRAIYSV